MRSAVSDFILAVIIVVFGVVIIFSSTKTALGKATDAKTKDNMYQLQQSIDYLVDQETNLLTYFSTCNISGSWCAANQSFIESTLLDPDTLEPILPGPLMAADKQYVSIRATGKKDYLIIGRSVKNPSLCWIASSDKKATNISSSEPTACP